MIVVCSLLSRALRFLFFLRPPPHFKIFKHKFSSHVRLITCFVPAAVWPCGLSKLNKKLKKEERVDSDRGARSG